MPRAQSRAGPPIPGIRSVTLVNGEGWPGNANNEGAVIETGDGWLAASALERLASTARTMSIQVFFTVAFRVEFRRRDVRTDNEFLVLKPAA